MKEYAVTVVRPPADELALLGRKQKYVVLKENTTRRKNDIVSWLKSQGLNDEVESIGSPTAFDVIFVTCSVEVANDLEKAPGVLKVEPSEVFKVTFD